MRTNRHQMSKQVNRREFITGAAAGAVALPAAVAADSAVVRTPRRDAPTAHRVDVLVCGGGPAGCAAAIYAARAGARTLLIENMPFLGGVWTAVGVSHLMAGSGRAGLNAEIHRRLPVHQVFDRNIYVIEEMKTLLDTLMTEAGVDVQLHTRAVYALRENDRLYGVFTESKSGLEYIKATMIIDATGDGDIAAAAGCAYEMGRPFDGRTQPVTLFGAIGGYTGEPMKGRPLTAILEKGGIQPSYPHVTLFPQPGQPGIFNLMATQFYGVDGTNVRDLTRAEFQGRREIRTCVEVFKAHGGDAWKDVFLINTGPAIGIRATRRIRGLYYLTWQDLNRGAQFEDGIAEIRSASNVHDVDDPYNAPPDGLPAAPEFQVRPYQIPLRSLIARDVENLFMAGRCISGDHYALGSYRLTGNVVQTGEAAGLAAATAAKENCTPGALNGKVLAKRLNTLRAETA